MSVASRIQEIETHIGDIYDTLEVGGTDLTDLNKNIVNINSSLKDRYKYFLNNGVEVIWNNWEKVIGEGTEFTLENTIQAPMKIDLKGNTYQNSTTGKNLLNIFLSTAPSTSNGITYTRNADGTVTANGTTTGISYYNIPQQELPAGSYILNGCPSGHGNHISLISKYGSSYQIDKGSGSSVFTISEPTTPTEFYIEIRQVGLTLNNVVFKPMIRLSSITDDTYEPYTGGNPAPNPDYPYPVNVVTGDNEVKVEGKNLFDKDSITVSNHYIDVNGGTTSAPDWLCTYDYVKIEPNTDYIVSFENMGARFIWAEYDENKTCIGNRHENTTGAIQTSSTAKYIRFCTNNPNATDIQLENGTQVTSYQPYQKESYPINLGDIELCKIGDYQDYFYKDNGKWYKYGAIGKVVLNGSESWSDFSVGDTNFRCQYDVALPNILTPPTNPAQLFSNYFKAINRDNAYAKTEIGIAQYGSALGKVFICAPNTILSEQTLASWKTWLSTHNTKVYYVLATPTYTEITDTTLLSQLEAVYKAISHDDQTNISQVNNDMPFKLEVTALKNI